MRTGAVMMGLALVTACARLPPKPPDQASRNRLQIQGYSTPPSQTLATYAQALTAEKYKVDNSHQAQGILIGHMQGGQIKRDVYVWVRPSATGSQARVSIQQTQPYDLTDEQGREYFYAPLYQRLYKRLSEPAAVAPATKTATATAPFFKKEPAATAPASTRAPAGQNRRQ